MATPLSSPSPPVVVAPVSKHTATVVFLHGLGGNASDVLLVLDTVKHDLPHVKWVLPNAPHCRVTVDLDTVEPAWFNIFSFDWAHETREDRQGLLASVRTIDGLIQDEVEGGIPAERIVLGGFSQGGATSLVVGLTRLGRGWKLGGVVTLSSWLPLDVFKEIASPHLGEVPVLMCHNKDDPTVAHGWAQRSTALLGDAGARGLSFRSYASDKHDVCAEALQDFGVFLKRVLA